MSFRSTGFLVNGFSDDRRALARLLAAFTCGVAAVMAQGFVNLDFELGTTPSDYDPFFTNPAERAVLLPGWATFYIRNEVESDLNSPLAFPYLFRGDSVCLGSACIWVRSTSASHGRFALSIDTGGACDSVYSCGIRQTAVVPADAKTLVFDGGGRLEVKINDVAVLPTPIGQTNGWTTHAVDVHPVAGQSVTLSFAGTGRGVGCQVTIGVGGLDNVRFVPQALLPVPNPALAWERVGQFGQFIVINYTGVLQQADSADGEFSDVPGARSPWWADSTVSSATFFRTRN